MALAIGSYFQQCYSPIAEMRGVIGGMGQVHNSCAELLISMTTKRGVPGAIASSPQGLGTS